MGRPGINGTLSYVIDNNQSSFQVRVGQIQHGVQMVADESTSRTRRAYYPHRLSATQFSIQVILSSYSERTLFSNYLNDYSKRALDPNLAGQFPQMQVQVPVRKFVRWGVPLNGIEWGEHIGAVIWTPTVTFETTIDWSIGDNNAPKVSSFALSTLASDQSPELKYFYPQGIQLSGNDVPAAGAYTVPVGPGDIASIISGGTSGGTNIGDQPILPPGANKPQNLNPF